MQEITTWFRVSVWGKQAESISQYLLKGRQVYVEGRLRTEEYTDRDGNKRISLEVTASDVQLLGSRSDGAGGGSGMGYGGGSQSGGQGGGSTYSEGGGGGGNFNKGGGEDDIPF